MTSLILAISGASGSPYSLRFLETLADTEIFTHILPSAVGAEVFEYETGKNITDIAKKSANFKLERYDDFFSTIASGSNFADAMVILPASMSTIGHIANGISANLLHRAAAVCLKERRKLVIAFREAPLTSIDLENMLKLSQAGAMILPLAPGFYHRPTNLDDIINFTVGKILDCLQIKNNLTRRWNKD
ncbi:MAG: UbiX family flavin prenyltransferase [Turicibacter sp.]|nr:UbiX family flavin prenyltransferase [Turicibacter sp.]